MTARSRAESSACVLCVLVHLTWLPKFSPFLFVSLPIHEEYIGDSSEVRLNASFCGEYICSVFSRYTELRLLSLVRLSSKDESCRGSENPAPPSYVCGVCSYHCMLTFDLALSLIIGYLSTSLLIVLRSKMSRVTSCRTLYRIRRGRQLPRQMSSQIMFKSLYLPLVLISPLRLQFLLKCNTERLYSNVPRLQSAVRIRLGGK